MATSASDFDLRDLRKKKIAVYLGIKPRDFERLQVVMNVFFQQAIGEQTAELPENNPLLKHQLLVVLDEFTAVGRMPDSVEFDRLCTRLQRARADGDSNAVAIG